MLYFSSKTLSAFYTKYLYCFSAYWRWIIIMNIHCIFIYIIQILDYKIYVWNFLGRLVIIFIKYLWIFERYKYTNRVWDFQSINTHLKLNALKTPLKWLWEQMLLCVLILTPFALDDLIYYYSDISTCRYIDIIFY